MNVAARVLIDLAAVILAALSGYHLWVAYAIHPADCADVENAQLVAYSGTVAALAALLCAPVCLMVKPPTRWWLLSCLVLVAVVALVRVVWVGETHALQTPDHVTWQAGTCTTKGD